MLAIRNIRVHILAIDTGKTTIKYGINGFPYYFTNGLIYGALTDLLEDRVREDAAK